MLKKVLAAGVAGAAALAGVALLGVGDAAAGKPVLNGTLHCNTSGTTTFSPGAVLSLAQLPKPKDKKIKVGTMADMLADPHPWIREYFHGPRARAAGIG